MRGLLLPDLNIVDLVKDAMRSRKRIRAKRRSQFCSALQTTGLLENFVGKRGFWRGGEFVAPHNSFLASPLPPPPPPVLQPLLVPKSVSTLIQSSSSNNKSKTVALKNESTYTDAFAEEYDYSDTS